MIRADVTRAEDESIRISGRFTGSTDELIDELACLCVDAIQTMAGDYEGQDDIADQLERALVEAIIARHAQNEMPFEGDDSGAVH